MPIWLLVIEYIYSRYRTKICSSIRLTLNVIIRKRLVVHKYRVNAHKVPILFLNNWSHQHIKVALAPKKT